MKPQEAVSTTEEIFDEAMAQAMAEFERASSCNDWVCVLRSLREIARIVSSAGQRLASYAGVAARQIKRQEKKDVEEALG